MCRKNILSTYRDEGLGKTAQLLKMHTALLAEDLNLILSSYFGEFTSAHDSSSTDPALSSGFCEHHTHMHTHIQQYIYIIMWFWQRIYVRFSSKTCLLSIIFNSSTGGSDALFWLLWVLHSRAQHTHIKTHSHTYSFVVLAEDIL